MSAKDYLPAFLKKILNNPSKQEIAGEYDRIAQLRKRIDELKIKVKKEKKTEEESETAIALKNTEDEFTTITESLSTRKKYKIISDQYEKLFISESAEKNESSGSRTRKKIRKKLKQFLILQLF